MTSENSKAVYPETSVVSYLTARATSNLLAAAWQAATTEWWDAHRLRFDLCTPALTIEEGWEVSKLPDEIIKELWTVKDSIAREHDNDVRKLAAYLQGSRPEGASGSPGRSGVEILDDAPGRRVFNSAKGVDDYIEEERASWSA